MTLLSHYFQPTDDPIVVSMAAEDWVDILAPFPRDAIQSACRQYMVEEPSRRPTPGAIRNLTAAAVKVKIDRERHLALAAPQRVAIPAPTDEDRERVCEFRRQQAERIMAGFAKTKTVAPAPVAAEPGERPGYLNPESPANALLRKAMVREEPMAAQRGEAGQGEEAQA